MCVLHERSVGRGRGAHGSSAQSGREWFGTRTGALEAVKGLDAFNRSIDIGEARIDPGEGGDARRFRVPSTQGSRESRTALARGAQERTKLLSLTWTVDLVLKGRSGRRGASELRWCLRSVCGSEAPRQGPDGIALLETWTLLLACAGAGPVRGSCAVSPPSKPGHPLAPSQHPLRGDHRGGRVRTEGILCFIVCLEVLAFLCYPTG